MIVSPSQVLLPQAKWLVFFFFLLLGTRPRARTFGGCIFQRSAVSSAFQNSVELANSLQFSLHSVHWWSTYNHLAVFCILSKAHYLLKSIGQSLAFKISNVQPYRILIISAACVRYRLKGQATSVQICT